MSSRRVLSTAKAADSPRWWRRSSAPAPRPHRAARRAVRGPDRRKKRWCARALAPRTPHLKTTGRASGALDVSISSSTSASRFQASAKPHHLHDERPHQRLVFRRIVLGLDLVDVLDAGPRSALSGISSTRISKAAPAGACRDHRSACPGIDTPEEDLKPAQRRTHLQRQELQRAQRSRPAGVLKRSGRRPPSIPTRSPLGAGSAGWSAGCRWRVGEPGLIPEGIDHQLARLQERPGMRTSRNGCAWPRSSGRHSISQTSCELSAAPRPSHCRPPPAAAASDRQVAGRQRFQSLRRDLVDAAHRAQIKRATRVGCRMA